MMIFIRLKKIKTLSSEISLQEFLIKNLKFVVKRSNESNKKLSPLEVFNFVVKLSNNEGTFISTEPR